MLRFWIRVSIRLFLIGGLLIFAAYVVGTMMPRGAVLAYKTDIGIGLSDVERRLSGLMVNDPYLTTGEPISWSPDGKQIAFQSGHDTADVFDLDVYVVSMADFSVRDVSQSPRIDGAPFAWSPDNHRLGFVSRTETVVDNRFVQTDENFFQVVDINSGQILQKFTQPDAIYEPAWVVSAKNVMIAFTTADNQLHVVMIDNQGATSAFTLLQNDTSKAMWSPDGRWIVFNSYINLNASLQLFDMQTLLTHELAPILADNIAWSPDNRHISYTTREQSEESSHETMYIGDVATGELKALTPPNMDDYYTPIWSPDGRQVVVVSDRNGTLALWSVDILTASSTKISTIDYGYIDTTVWSPNGRWLAVYAYALEGGPKKPYINLIDVQNRIRVYLTDGNFPAWRP